MQLGLPFRAPTAPSGGAVVTVGGHAVAVEFVRHRRARHYIIRVDDDGRLRVTIPWGGSRAQALAFVRERRAWIERERYRRALAAARRQPWGAGREVLYRGSLHALQVDRIDARRARVSFADQHLVVAVNDTTDLRGPVEAHLRRVASDELPRSLAALAAAHGFTVKAVSIRNQRSRWGSCSRSGRISLNWRLIQFPAHVADYVIVHELAHLRHLNHSRRFWAEVARLCPDYQAARAWLRAHHRSDADAR